MPRIKRWFPVSHDINRDVDLWELEKIHGPKVLRVWLELLSIADRNDGYIPGDEKGICENLRVQCRISNRTPIQSLFNRLLDLHWTSIEPPVAPALHPRFKITNYWKYHRTQEQNRVPPDPTEPDPTIKDKEKRRIHIAQSQFPDDWQWLKNWVENQNSEFPKERFLDWSWWDNVSEACGGLSEDWLNEQSAKWRRWILDNPGRAPTPKGYRKFVAGWLERSYDRERRFGNGKTTR